MAEADGRVNAVFLLVCSVGVCLSRIFISAKMHRSGYECNNTLTGTIRMVFLWHPCVIRPAIHTHRVYTLSKCKTSLYMNKIDVAPDRPIRRKFTRSLPTSAARKQRAADFQLCRMRACVRTCSCVTFVMQIGSKA